MLYYRQPYSNELYHHGVQGMHWGVRRYQNPDGTLTAAGRAKYLTGRNDDGIFSRISNGIRKAEASKSISDVSKKAADKAKKVLSERQERRERLKQVDPELAKNKQTRRVAYDYHNLDELQFRKRYMRSKKTFAKRYVRSDGDTYSMGKRKAVLSAFVVANSKDVPYLDLRTGKVQTVKMGKDAALKSLAMDVGYSEAVTRLGYNKAEKKYKDGKENKK